jgi:hypothetical protein
VHDEAVYSAGRTLPEEFSRGFLQIVLPVASKCPEEPLHIFIEGQVASEQFLILSLDDAL